MEDEDAAVIFDSIIFKYIIDVLVISTIEEYGNSLIASEQCLCFEFSNHKYVGKQSNLPVLIEKCCSCNNSMSQVEILFPDKLHNQFGRLFSVSTFHFTPYANLDTMKGAELSMVTTFMERYNLTGEFIIEDDKWGEVSGNFVGKGSQYTSSIGAADLSVGGFYGMEKRYFYNQFSIPTIRNGLTFLVPAPSQGRGLTTPLRSFSTTSWLYMCLFYLVTVVFQYLLYYLYTKLLLRETPNKEVFFSLCGIVLQQHVNIKFRVFGGFALIFGILFTAFYSSGLSSIMTKPSYVNEIKTPEQLETSNLDTIAYSDSYIYFIKTDLKYQNIVKKFRAMNETELEYLMKRSNTFALAIDHLDLGYSLGDYETVISIKHLERFRLLKDDLAFEYCVFLGVKHSVIMPLLDRHILNLKESGLDYYWQSEGFREMNYKMQLYFISEYSYPTIKLNWRSVEGAFGFLGIGLFVALLQFIHEMVKYYKYAK